MKYLYFHLLLLLPVLLTQCATSTLESETTNTTTPTHLTKLDTSSTFRKKGYWIGNTLSGKPSIRISLDEQLAYFYKGSSLAGITPVSTGKPGYGTPTGTFKITQKSKDHKSNLYGVIINKSTNEVVNGDADSRHDKPAAGERYEGAPMPNFMRFNGAIGMHSGRTPNYPASHGCVRMPHHMAEIFYKNAPKGTIVIVSH